MAWIDSSTYSNIRTLITSNSENLRTLTSTKTDYGKMFDYNRSSNRSCIISA